MLRTHLPTQEARVPLQDQEDPLEEGMATHSTFLPGRAHGQRRLVGYSPWVRESDTADGLDRHALYAAHVWELCAGLKGSAVPKRGLI